MARLNKEILITDIKPTRGNLLIRLLNTQILKEQSMIYIPDKVKSDAQTTGLVVAVGDTVVDKKGRGQKIQCKLGDTVYFKRTWHREFVFNDEIFAFIKHDEVVCVEDEIKLNAVRDTIIIKRQYTGKIANSTLIIPETHGIQSNHEDFIGLVISVGEKYPYKLKEGNRITYRKNEGVKFISSGEEYFSLKERYVESVIDENL